MTDVPDDAAVGGLDAQFLDVDGVRTRYYDEGGGEPVVLLHGGTWLPYHNANDWAPAIPGLADHFRVVAPDRIASGLTDNPPDEADYVYGTELDHALSFLDTLGLDRCHLVGSSRGAGLAARIAVERPDRVASLVVVNSSTLAPAVGDYDHRWRLLARGQPDQADAFEAFFRHHLDSYSYRSDHVTEEYVAAAAHLAGLPKVVERDAAMLAVSRTPSTFDLKGYADTFAETLEAHMRETRRRITDEVLDAPVLIVWGRNDPTIPLRAGLSLFEVFSGGTPHVRLYVFDRCGHFSYREYPDEFVRIVGNFIASAP